MPEDLAKLIAPDLFAHLEPAEQAELMADLGTQERPWEPDPDNAPQNQAYYSTADVVGYGGAAGGGKTDLACGLSVNEHQVVGFFRDTGTEMTAVVDRLAQILGGRKGYNGQDRIWRFTRYDGVEAQIELGSFPHGGDEEKYRGRPHDLLVFDEAASMREAAVRFVMGWLRTTDPDQRCRVLMCFNPPTESEGRWVVRYFAPWLDDMHPNPAEPGELRWFAQVGENEQEVDGPEPFDHKGELVIPRSRTFIPARLADNKHLAGTGYEATLQAMDEPFRSQMLYGDFGAGQEDDPHQIIPTAWVDAAMARWKDKDRKEPMDSMGVDVALGGKDKTVIARRHGMWFDKPIAYKGVDCPDGATVAGYCIAAQRDRCMMHVDEFGVGARPIGHLHRARAHVLGVVMSETKVFTRTKHGGYGFGNVRAELWWKMREALDPEENNAIALPPDRHLRADLCLMRYEERNGMIWAESRDKIVKRAGRSPDWGTAYVLALMSSPTLEQFRDMGGKAEEYDPMARF